MWAEGWTSEDQLTTNGWGSGLGYSIWFNRWDWHGKKLTAFRATYHAHGLASEGIMRVAEKAASLAREAWAKFPDEPPNQMAHYVLQSPGDYVLSNVRDHQSLTRKEKRQ
jgi:hypothetical protein